MLITACIYHFLVRNRLLGDKYTQKHRGKEVQQHQVLFKMILFLFRSNGYITIVRKIQLKKSDVETSLLAQLRLCFSNVVGVDLIYGWETKILHAAGCSQKKEK